MFSVTAPANVSWGWLTFAACLVGAGLCCKGLQCLCSSDGSSAPEKPGVLQYLPRRSAERGGPGPWGPHGDSSFTCDPGSLAPASHAISRKPLVRSRSHRGPF